MRFGVQYDESSPGKMIIFAQGKEWFCQEGKDGDGVGVAE